MDEGKKGWRIGTILKIVVLFFVIVLVIVESIYYFHVNEEIEKTSKEYSENMMNQLEENIKITIDGVMQIAFNLVYDEYVIDYIATNDIKKKLELDDYVTNMIRSVTFSNENIFDVLFSFKDDTFKSYHGSTELSLYKELMGIYKSMDIGVTKRTITDVLNKSNNNLYAIISPVYNISLESEANQYEGLLVIMCKMDNIQRILSKTEFTENSVFSIVNNENKILASNNESIIGNVLSDSIIEEDNHIIVWKKNITPNGWSLVGAIPKGEVSEDIAYFRWLIVSSGVVMLLMMFLLVMALNHYMTRPITNLVKGISRIADKNLKDRIKVSQYRSGEIAAIAQNINIMLEKIEDMTNKIFTNQQKLYEMELSKKHAELASLQSQINPHFLYNTLECIRSIATIYDSREIEDISIALSKIFKYSIRDDETVLIKEEIEIIEKYLQIMIIRFSERFSYFFEIEEDILYCKTLKMILQPIVENAIYHGMEDLFEGGELYIRGYKKGKAIIFEVEDNGKGMDKNTYSIINLALEKSRKEAVKGRSTHGIGIINIDKRIKLNYGDDYGISIMTKEGEGTIVNIKIPSDVEVI